MRSAPPKSNRLIHETSPYLRQHADNPVDWHPWGPEALEKAASERMPIFLSIGYSACHWCHVMEHESFENNEIAAFLNENFVSIKVDREERPDLDAVYMNAVLAMTGHGGWPMSVFLTPERRPFFGGTYWPPAPIRGMPGFLNILQHIDHAWRKRGEEVAEAADELVRAISKMGEPIGQGRGLSQDLIDSAARDLIEAADRRHGGFGRAPKFPSPLPLRNLLRYGRRANQADPLQIAGLTLDRMARGGMYDQLGGGFHRYSTDAEWLVPHFEKMLYDQALLVPAYLEAWQATADGEFAAVARETLEYVLREMTAPNGGFYSTQDADTEGVEGKFFTWSAAEIDDALDSGQAPLARRFYGVHNGGNWEGTNILHRPARWEDASAREGIALPALRERIDAARERLFQVRSTRAAPPIDDKQIVSWNGLMIAALARAGFSFGEERYLSAARHAAEFMLTSLRDPEGNLLHTFREGRARHGAFLDDYAALADGLAILYESTGEPEWLQESIALADQLLETFHAGDGGLYFAPEAGDLIVRQQDTQDNATPSGSGLAATLLVRLARLAGRGDFERRAEQLLERASGQIAAAPMASGQSMIALEMLLAPPQEIVIVGEAAQRRPFQQVLGKTFLPNAAIHLVSGSAAAQQLPESTQEILAGKLGTAPAAFVCEDRTCRAPARTPDELREQLRQAPP